MHLTFGNIDGVSNWCGFECGIYGGLHVHLYLPLNFPVDPRCSTTYLTNDFRTNSPISNGRTARTNPLESNPCRPRRMYASFAGADGDGKEWKEIYNFDCFNTLHWPSICTHSLFKCIPVVSAEFTDADAVNLSVCILLSTWDAFQHRWQCLDSGHGSFRLVHEPLRNIYTKVCNYWINIEGVKMTSMARHRWPPISCFESVATLCAHTGNTPEWNNIENRNVNRKVFASMRGLGAAGRRTIDENELCAPMWAVECVRVSTKNDFRVSWLECFSNVI